MNQNQQLPPPWALGSKDIQDIPMLVVHMGNGELEGLDNLQGGPSIDEETGIREYSQLSNIIEVPEIRQLFQTVSSQVEEHGQLSPELNEAYENSKENTLPFRETDEEKHNPLDKLEKTGRNGDSKLAYIPMNLAELLVEMRHIPSVNPKTGLLEFWKFKNFLKSVVRVAGTIGGALLGGPLGAGIGNALAGAATGQKLGHAAMSGLKNVGLAYGAQGLGQAAGLTGATPYSSGFFGGAPNALATGLGGLGIGSAGAAASAAPGAAGIAGAASAAQPLSHAQQAQQLITSVMTQPQSQGLLGTIANAGKSLAPYAPLAVGALSYMGSKQHHKHENHERERQEEKWNEERKRMGWDVDWTPVTKQYEENPEYWNLTEEDLKHGRAEPRMREVGNSNRYAKGGLIQSYKEGTLIKGKGKGQEDLIKTSVPDGSYIWDASVTSMLGDGSSEAGAKVIKSFEDHVRSKIPKKILKNVEEIIKRRSNKVPVWLSDREYKSDPVVVSLTPYALGQKEISNEKGADILRATIKKVRKHKTQAGSGLPPKAKPLLEYMRMSRG